MTTKLVKQIVAAIGSVFVVYYVSMNYDSLKKMAAK
jgi:hypothetical protein